MKKIIATLMLSFTMLTFAAPVSMAKNIDDQSSSSFNIFDIFKIGDEETTLAEDLIQEGDEHFTNPVGAIILRAINMLTLLVGTFAFIMLVIGGFMFMTAAGDESRVDRGKAAITQSIGGLLIAFLAYYAVVGIQSFFY